MIRQSGDGVGWWFLVAFCQVLGSRSPEPVNLCHLRTRNSATLLNKREGVVTMTPKGLYQGKTSLALHGKRTQNLNCNSAIISVHIKIIGIYWSHENIVQLLASL